MKRPFSNSRLSLPVVMVLVALLALAGFAAYRILNKEELPEKVKASISTCESIYKDKDLCKFTGTFAGFDKVSYKLTLTTESGGQKSTTTYTNDGSGNFATASKTDGQTTNTVTTKDAYYLKDETDGKWFKFTTNQGNPKGPGVPKTNPIDDINFGYADDKLQAAISFKKLGEEKCGDKNCFKYQMTDKSHPDTTIYFWFDKGDYQLQRFQTKDANGTTDMVITYGEFTVKAPSPVKEFSMDGGKPDPALIQQYEQSTGGSSDDPQSAEDSIVN